MIQDLLTVYVGYLCKAELKFDDVVQQQSVMLSLMSSYTENRLLSYSIRLLHSMVTTTIANGDLSTVCCATRTLMRSRAHRIDGISMEAADGICRTP